MEQRQEEHHKKKKICKLDPLSLKQFAFFFSFGNSKT